jgi:hypothetical protein
MVVLAVILPWQLSSPPRLDFIGYCPPKAQFQIEPRAMCLVPKGDTMGSKSGFCREVVKKQLSSGGRFAMHEW